MQPCLLKKVVGSFFNSLFLVVLVWIFCGVLSWSLFVHYWLDSSTELWCPSVIACRKAWKVKWEFLFITICTMLRATEHLGCSLPCAFVPSQLWMNKLFLEMIPLISSVQLFSMGKCLRPVIFAGNIWVFLSLRRTLKFVSVTNWSAKISLWTL